jgi:signal transduction histidine kinase/CheY-like chemotaxis protein
VSERLLSVRLRYEEDLVIARQRTRQLARALGFDGHEPTRLATAVSEIARNAFRYAGGGLVEFAVEGATAPQLFEIRVTDAGPGIANLPEVLGGRYHSTTGMGLGIVGARRLMDQFEIVSAPGQGTAVVLRKILPRAAPFVTARRLSSLLADLAREAPRSAVEEVQRQNQELLLTLDELRRRQEELTQLNHELEDTNRGVVALYAELDEKADHLRRADDLKSRFLNNVSHEFRTLLNSILALSHILLDRIDGPLTEEQEKQVAFIRKGAQDLTELVNDLLDLAKVEAGKIVIRPIEFEVSALFGALRGMLRPLLVNESVHLVFESPEGIDPLFTDEGKVSQILRNFISNALKFTERGEVRVAATVVHGGDAVEFSVSDTGIGIAPEDQELIFEEFTQLENPVQKRIKGTGLGLPLTRRLAALLGGGVSVTSRPGVGSRFTATIPVNFQPAVGGPAAPVPEMAPGLVPVLVVDDEPQALAIFDRYLHGSEFQLLTARSLREARRLIRSARPRAIVLDIRLEGEDAWEYLAELKRDEGTRDIPLAVVSTVDDRRKGLMLGADVYGVKPIDRQWLLDTLRRLTAGSGASVLVVDDDEGARYVLKRLLATLPCRIQEAGTAKEGLRLARQTRPDVIFLDLILPDELGTEVLAQLKADPISAGIPVIILTSKALEDNERAELERRAVAVLSKGSDSLEAALSSLQEAWARAGLALR